MQDKFKIEGENLVIKIPLKKERFNPYDDMYGDGGHQGIMMNNIVAVIDRNGSNWDELGFAHWIDMDYKGKGDQVSALFFTYLGGEEEFRKLVEELKLDLVEM